MFSGIIEKTGKISRIERNSDGARLVVSVDSFMDGVKLGDSIALNGTCITVVSFDSTSFESDLSNETLKKTTLAYLEVGHDCNLEKAMLLNERIGGHLVSGHIDGLGKEESIEKDGESFWFKIKADKQISTLSGSIKDQVVTFVGEENIELYGKNYLTDHFKLKSKNQELPKDK